MIKVGQIRKPKKEYYNKAPDSLFKIVISYTADDDYCSLIYENGNCLEEVPSIFVEEKTELIAEYPTWQEAVNSKEFKND